MPRVYVEGVLFVEEKDSATHEVEVGKLSIGGQEIFIEMIRNISVNTWADFLPARVYDAERDLWNFKQENFRGVGKLINCYGELVIVLVNKSQQIDRVVPIADLTKVQKIKVGDQIEFIGGRGILELFQLKIAASKQLRLEIFSSPEEVELLRLTREAEEASKKAEYVAREEARQERLRRILSRPDVSGYTVEGKHCHGTPVTGEEWQSLPNDHPAILVEGYNNEAKIPGQLIEAFFVKKGKGGRAEKHLSRKVSAEKPVDQSKELPTAKGVFNFLIGKQVQRILAFSREDINHFRKTGLNSGTLLAVDPKDEKGRFEIVELKDGRCDSVGLFAPLQ